MPTREEMHNLAQGIIGAFEARTDGIAYLRREVGEHRQAAQAHLRAMDRDHQAMARRQRGELARGRAALQEEVGGYRQGTQVHLREIEAAVMEHRQATQTQLHELDQAHQSMAHQLRSDLRRGCASFSKAEARRKAKFHSWIGRVAAERAAGQKEWHRLAATMAAKRNGA